MGHAAMPLALANRLAVALGTSVDQLFPKIKAQLAKLGKETALFRSIDDPLEEALRAGGVEADPTTWCAVMTFRGGLQRKYQIDRATEERLERMLSIEADEVDPGTGEFFYFHSMDTEHEVIVNMEHLVFCHVLFERGRREPKEGEKDYPGIVRVWMASVAEALEFKLETEDRDEDGQVPLVRGFFEPLDWFGTKIGDKFVSFVDEDGERAYFNRKDIVLAEAGSEIVYPDCDDDFEDEEEVEEEDPSSATAPAEESPNREGV